MTAYYNEIDPFAVQWLKNLISAGLIADGEVDSRPIQEVTQKDLDGFTQCHFFAGIGGWSYALRLAGVPDDFPVWTGSCPCQPFSVAGRRKGTADERHVWPEFKRLIAERGPTTVFGEQVASKDGRDWLSGVRSDLETLGYAVGSADLCAAGVGAPHIRQRLYWLGNSASERLLPGAYTGVHSSEKSTGSWNGEPERPGSVSGLAESPDFGLNGWGQCDGRNEEGERRETPKWGIHREQTQGRSSVSGFWTEREWISCADGRARAVEPGTFPLAHGVPARVGRLRGYGNAIVPQVAAEFIRAALSK